MNNPAPTLRARVLRWFASGTTRRAIELRRQVRRLINEQRDLLAPDAVRKMDDADRELAEAVRTHAEVAVVQEKMTALEAVANEQLMPYPGGAIRENTKEILVAVTVIFAFTTFFLQLTKIPTNSLVPTLYGITSQDLRKTPDFKIPGLLTRFVHYWISGVSYVHVVAKADGPLQSLSAPVQVVPFVKKQTLKIGGISYPVWFPPDRFEERAQLEPGRWYHAGDEVVKLRVVSGDHLLVDRFTYNFRRPKRGEIFVFKTRGIERLADGLLYIKRLVALGGERVRIGDDQHLVINGQRLDATTPHFENVYTFPPVPKEYQYFGHVNQKTARRFGHFNVAERFKDGTTELQVQPRHYLAMGDNTMNSYDSRDWGDVPQENVIGKCWFVYWPFTERFGWGTR